jgi:hypothetical protein
MIQSLTAECTYQITEDMKIGNCVFHKGDIVIYSSGGYSPYDDCYIYHFIGFNGTKFMCITQVQLSSVDLGNFKII